MPKSTQFTHEDRLKSIPLPTHKGRYTVVSHEFIIDTTKAKLQKSGYEVKQTFYKSNISGEVAQGVYHLTYGDDPDMSLMFAWVNSYDKSLRFRCAIGALVEVSNNIIIAGDMANYGRKHMGDANDHVKTHIEGQIDTAVSHFKALVHDKNNMKNVTVTDQKMHEYYGHLALKGFLSVNQLTVMKNQMIDADFTYSSNSNDVWTLYNHALHSIRSAHPRTWMEQQKDLHKITKKLFISNAPAYNPNQVTLQQAIDEVETVTIPADEVNLQDLQDVQDELDKKIEEMVEETMSETTSIAKEMLDDDMSSCPDEEDLITPDADSNGAQFPQAVFDAAEEWEESVMNNKADEEADMIKNEEIIEEREQEDIFNSIADVIRPKTSEVNELDDLTVEKQVEETEEQELDFDGLIEQAEEAEIVEDVVEETEVSDEESSESDESNDELLELPDFDF